MRLKFKTPWNLDFSLLFLKYFFLLWCTNTVIALIIQEKFPCDDIDVNSFEGVITSPNYPLPYPDEVKCDWRIRTPFNSALRIEVLDLDISEDDNCPKTPCCSHHYLSISRAGNHLLLCGNNTDERIITVVQPETFIKYFSSKTNTRGRGFKITYSIHEHTCKPNEFRCRNGKCLPFNSFCNGFNDCEDGSDEVNCLHSSQTRYDTLKKNVIHYENHGVDMQDMCIEGTVQCPLSPDHCYSPVTDVCNDKFDCPKGEDEVDCVPGCPKQIACSSGDGCYYPMQRCNSVRNCRDNSDETGCPAEPCVALQFTCLNGACISGSTLCDGDDDCGDLSDEENCSKSSFMKAAVVGLLTCIMLFCIVLGCMYYVYTARLRASANFVHHLEAEPSDDDFIYREPPPAYSDAVNDRRIITYPPSDITERCFDIDHPMRFHRNRNTHRSRRQQPLGNTELMSNARSRSRGSTTSQNCVLPEGSEPQSQPKPDDHNKIQERANRLDFHRHLDFYGIGCRTQTNGQILPTNSYRNESPCSSPSLSPSRESITSCTSLEEMEDLVSLFHH